MIRKIRISALACKCQCCTYDWVSIAKKLPTNCANSKCRSREWNGVKERVIKPKIHLPKPKRVRTVDL